MFSENSDFVVTSHDGLTGRQDRRPVNFLQKFMYPTNRSGFCHYGFNFVKG